MVLWGVMGGIKNGGFLKGRASNLRKWAVF